MAGLVGVGRVLLRRSDICQPARICVSAQRIAETTPVHCDPTRRNPQLPISTDRPRRRIRIHNSNTSPGTRSHSRRSLHNSYSSHLHSRTRRCSNHMLLHRDSSRRGRRIWAALEGDMSWRRCNSQTSKTTSFLLLLFLWSARRWLVQHRYGLGVAIVVLLVCELLHCYVFVVSRSGLVDWL